MFSLDIIKYICSMLSDADKLMLLSVDKCMCLIKKLVWFDSKVDVDKIKNLFYKEQFTHIILAESNINLFIKSDDADGYFGNNMLNLPNVKKITFKMQPNSYILDNMVDNIPQTITHIYNLPEMYGGCDIFEKIKYVELNDSYTININLITTRIKFKLNTTKKSLGLYTLYTDDNIIYLKTSVTIDQSFFIPNNITHLHLSDVFNYPIILPDSIINITFGENFDQNILLPKNIQQVIFGKNFNRQILIPDTVTHLKFGSKFNKHIVLPSSIKHLIMGKNFDRYIILPSGIKHLTVGKLFDCQIIIPDTVTYLKFGNKFNQKIIVPNSVKTLIFGEDYNQEIIIPKSVTELSIPAINIKIEPNIKSLTLIGALDKEYLENLPDTITELIIKNNIKYDEYIIEGLANKNNITTLHLMYYTSGVLKYICPNIKILKISKIFRDTELDPIPKFIEELHVYSADLEVYSKLLPVGLKRLHVHKNHKKILSAEVKRNVRVTYLKNKC